MYGESEDDRTMQALHDAILDALFNGGVLPEETLERLLGDPADADQADARSKLEELIQHIIDRMMQEGLHLAGARPRGRRAERQSRGTGGGFGPDAPPTRFEVTDKSLDFLGYRALRDLLGSLGKSSLGRHDTRDHATGIETIAAPKPYEFGDTLNLDPSSTRAQRGAARARRDAETAREPFRGHPGPDTAPGACSIDITYEDLMVAQGEYQSSCATVLMLDCSHSMILYGEDRFTPAKRVALALAQSHPAAVSRRRAERRPVSRLGRGDSAARAGPRAGGAVLHEHARRPAPGAAHPRPAAQGHAPDHHDHRRQAVGADAARRTHLQERLRPRPVHRLGDLAEVAACRKSGIMINTFMLARDYDLVASCDASPRSAAGKAYFTTPYTLGQYVLMDYMDKKTRTIH